MPSDQHPSGARRSLSKSRMEAFSDGVFAIAVTLLVLDLVLHPPGSPLKRLFEAWPIYLSVRHQLPDDRRGLAPCTPR